MIQSLQCRIIYIFAHFNYYMKITEMEGKVLKKVVKRFMVFVLVITLATCNTGTGFLLVKAEEKLETKEKTELGSNVNNEGYCKQEVVEEIVSDLSLIHI